MEKLTRRESMILRFMYDMLQYSPIIGVKQVADFLGVSSPSAYEILSRLTNEKKLLIRIEKKGYVLSKRGKIIAKQIVVVHRVLELFFCNYFGLDSDCACRIASHIDFMIDQDKAERALKTANLPLVCPHNKEIPIGDDDE